MYQPQLLTAGDLETLKMQLKQEFATIAREQSQPSEYLALKTLYAEPKRIFDGMVIKADGTTWDPGSGAGVYAYVGGAWVAQGGGGGGGGATNLSYTASPTSGVVVSDTGTDATLTLADATNAGLMAPAQHSKLAGIAAGAQVNPASTDALSEGSTNLYHTAARVRATVLTGLSTAAGTVVTAAHTVLEAIGFLQKQTSDNTSAISGKQATLVSGTNIKTINSITLLGSGDIVVGGGGSAFPVGAIFIAAVSTDPATLLGYGTWAAFGAGRVLVGRDAGDADFDTAEEVGGAKTKAISAHAGAAVASHASHTHTYTDVPNHTHPVTITDPGHQHIVGSTSTTGTSLNTFRSGSGTLSNGTVQSATTGITASTSNPTGGVASGTTGSPSATLTHSVTQPGAHTDLNVVQPYIVVYMWKRTA